MLTQPSANGLIDNFGHFCFLVWQWSAWGRALTAAYQSDWINQYMANFEPARTVWGIAYIGGSLMNASGEYASCINKEQTICVPG